MYDESCRYIEGVWLNKFFKEENVRSAINYKPRDGDVFLVTYPKCGTTWMQHIISNILTRGMPPTDIGEFSIMAPYIDMTGAKAAEIPSRTGPITTHLPPSVFKPVERAKYVYVTRNPYDCAVSYYHFALGMTPKSATDVSFESFLDIFISGKVPTNFFLIFIFFRLPRYETVTVDENCAVFFAYPTVHYWAILFTVFRGLLMGSLIYRRE